MFKRSVLLLCLLTLVAGAARSLQADDFFGLFKKAIRGSGDIETESREVKEFTRISSSGSFDIYVVVGKEQSIEISYDDNLLEYIETKVRGRTLKLKSRESIDGSRGCRIDITVRSLSEISLAGSGDIEVSRITGNSFDCSLAGSGSIELEGEVDEVDVSMSGSGDIDARELIAERADVSISGSGDIDVYASEWLDASVSGSGDIRYFGNPAERDRHVSGSGSIKKGR